MGVPSRGVIPATLTQRGAARFWFAVIVTGIGTGIAAVVLNLLLAQVQHWAWPGSDELADAAARASAWRHLLILLAAGLLTGSGQLILVRLSVANGIDITEAIWFRAGRMPAVRTLGSAVLSVVIVAMGVSLGREGAPKQTGAVIADALADRCGFSDERRRLLVACGAGAGLAAAYGVPVGGALFALEVMRGVLALRLILPALVTCLIATSISWLTLPEAPTYTVPAYSISLSVMCWCLLAGPISGLVSVAYVRTITWVDNHRPVGWRRLVAPMLAFGVLGVISIPFPELLGNGKDIVQLAFGGELAVPLLFALLLLKPAATCLSLGSGAPGGMFTPTLAVGSLLGGVLGSAWSLLWPNAPAGLYALIGAAAVLAATTQGPISAVVLMIELTGRNGSFVVPVLLAVSLATLVARSIERRSIYDARLNEEQISTRQEMRNHLPG